MLIFEINTAKEGKNKTDLLFSLIKARSYNEAGPGFCYAKRLVKIINHIFNPTGRCYLPRGSAFW